MKIDEITLSFRMMGFNFSTDTQTVSTDKKIFARIFENTLIGFGGVKIPLDSISNVTLNQIDLQIDVFLKDGTSISISGKNRRLDNSLTELMSVLPFFAEDIDDNIYYDEMAGRDIVNTKLWSDPMPLFKKAEDADLSKFRYLIESGCEKYGFKACFSRETRTDAWIILCDKYKRNPWSEWLESLKWDGIHRLETWFTDCLGAGAPPLREIGKESMYISEVTKAWFVGAVARAYAETKHEIVPVLIGKQGDGKSEFVRYTAYSDDWYRESISKFEDEKTFREKTEGAKVIELAESKQLRSANVEELKMFISKSSDMYRESYGRKSREFRRHWVLIATSNDSKIFIDKTGNRRFFPMFCDMSRIKRNFYEDKDKHEVEQLWAEAYILYKSGAPCKFERDSEIVHLSEIMQLNSTYEDDTWTAIDTYLDDPYNIYSEKGAEISKTEIYNNILDVDARKPPKEVRYSVNSWIENNKVWKNSPVKWYNGKTTKNVLTRMSDAEMSDLPEEKIVEMYMGFIADKGYHSYDLARIDDFIRDKNIKMSIMKIKQVLVDNCKIFERQGSYYLY